MSDRASALGADFRTGLFGDTSDGAGVTLGETFFDFVAELAAFPDAADKVEKLIGKATASVKTSLAFKIARNRRLVAGMLDFRKKLEAGMSPGEASLVELTHGRSAFHINGPKAEWVLAKLFPIDFSIEAFPVQSGLATTHHDIFTQIYRRHELSFDLFVFRSFARSFWHTLRRAAEETGYEVV